ncbi:sugar phosphorylase [Clostridium sp. MCC353]|uniref:sugar phosphorylase n=1 Tax=Clostridium sp. MCC353 TaxID=2592646 RepID=UPI001C00B37E|nr:sugar phosphorylase [Clostridium sp. MCC353]MBT9774940.1 sugar phosphorylase [Clostridium sp. MCC353]
MGTIKDHLQYLYPDCYEILEKQIGSLMEFWKNKANASYPQVDQTDVMLITYGDGIKRKGEAPLHTLREFLDQELRGTVSAVHLLPMFPYTSDDGFSVVDFRQINPELGGWEDVERLGGRYDLMFDAVINHVSASSSYYKKYASGDEGYRDFFIESDPDGDYSQVIRPRTLPLLTRFETSMGIKYLWTTFSEDQIDLNYKSPQVLLEVLDVLLFYASKGARFLRFDAIGFAWKEQGTTCMHLPQTHELIKLMRCVIESCFKGCTIITETNVPHEENISYFGSGYDEAGMVYQFPLPPLTLYAYLSGNAAHLTYWAMGIQPVTETATYFNFLASHDGIGLRPVEDLLSGEERRFMVDEVLKRGGQIGYRSLADKNMVPYELNINYLDAIAGDETDTGMMARKFLGSQCVLLSLMGVPGIYYHSLLGSRNCYKDFEESGIKRRINREKLDADQLKEELSDPGSLRARVLTGFQAMLRVRRGEEAFSPNRLQEVVKLDDRVFALLRGEGEGRILALINVSRQQVECRTGVAGEDLLSGRKIKDTVLLEPYEYMWIKQGSGQI